MDGSSGVISLSGTISASGDTPALRNGQSQGYSGVDSSFSWNFDNRSVAISSSLEPTYHKDSGTGLPVQNARATSGFMVADTVAPTPSSSVGITYNPLYTRSQWGTASQYKWQTTQASTPLSGTFNTILYDVPSLPANYINPPITPGSNDYITLTLTDSKDGASASNNYSVLFHDYYENWKRLTRTPHPVSFTNLTGAGTEWTRLVVINSPDSVAGTAHVNQAYSDSVTQSGTIGTQGSLTAPGVAALQRNENITNGLTVTGTITTSYDFPGIPYERVSWYVAKTYEERTGTTDAYTTYGFQGTQSWHGVFATNPMLLSTTYSVDFRYSH